MVDLLSDIWLDQIRVYQRKSNIDEFICRPNIISAAATCMSY